MMNEYQGYLSNSLFIQQLKRSKQQIESNILQNQTFENEQDSHTLNGIMVLNDCTNKLNQTVGKNQKKNSQYNYKIHRKIDKQNEGNDQVGFSRRQNLLIKKQRSKSRKKSLLYFKQNQSNLQSQIKINIPMIKKKKQVSEKQQSFVQEYQIQNDEINKQVDLQTPNLIENTSTIPNYFKKQLKTQFDQNSGTYRIQRCRTQYQCFSNNKCERSYSKKKKMTLKQKIQSRIKVGKELKQKNAKKCYLQQRQKPFRPSIYKPLQNNPLKYKQSQIFSTDPFLQRQNKTIENKKSKIQQLKKQLIYHETKQCTFKPITNIYKKK